VKLPNIIYSDLLVIVKQCDKCITRCLQIAVITRLFTLVLN